MVGPQHVAHLRRSCIEYEPQHETTYSREIRLSFVALDNELAARFHAVGDSSSSLFSISASLRLTSDN
jgi:hypothetical protein